MGIGMKREELKPDWAWAKKAPYGMGSRCGDMVFVSGQVAYDAAGEIVGGSDMEAQTEQVFANIREVLALAGASLDDVMKVTIFMVDMDQYEAYGRARSRAFAKHRPASTLIPVEKLIRPGLLVEIEAIAIVGAGSD